MRGMSALLFLRHETNAEGERLPVKEKLLKAIIFLYRPLPALPLISSFSLSFVAKQKVRGMFSCVPVTYRTIVFQADNSHACLMSNGETLMG